MHDDLQAELQSEHDQLTEDLVFAANNHELGEVQQELARSWRQDIDIAREQALAPRPIAFIAKVGRGKSTMIAAATGLRVDAPAGAKPTAWSVLPVGGGRTTPCETEIVFEAREDISLEVEAMAREDLELELAIMAEDFTPAPADGDGATQDEAGHNQKPGEELFGLLSAWLAPEAEDAFEALEAEGREVGDPDKLRARWFKRLDLNTRSANQQRSFDAGPQGMAVLRHQLEALMTGRLEGAPAPRYIRLRLPQVDGSLEGAPLIDTRGVDGPKPELWFMGRRDLEALFRDGRVSIVACSSWDDAPDPVSAAVLERVEAERGRRLVLVDKDSASASARKKKIRQCERQLSSASIAVDKSEIVAIDAQREGPALLEHLRELGTQTRARALAGWRKQLDQARQALPNLEREGFARRTRELDLRLRWVWDATLASEYGHNRAAVGLMAVAAGLEQLNQREWMHARLNASARRRGRYPRLSLVTLGADVSTMAQLAPYDAALGAVSQTVDELRAELDDPDLLRHVDTRLNYFERALATLMTKLYLAWGKSLSAYFRSPESNEMWRKCVVRWGQGEGYVRDVVAYIREEAAKARLPPVHVDIEDHLPKAPPLLRLDRITLTNFRCVEARSLTLDPQVTVLIGDNGVGKTTWLEAIVAGVGAFLPGLDIGPAPALSHRDVRQVVHELGGRPDLSYQVPMRIELEGALEGHPSGWSRGVTKVLRENLAIVEDALEHTALQLEAQRVAEDVRAGRPRQLPLLAYYGTQRLWLQVEADKSRRQIDSRLDGYRRCLDAASDHRHMLDWVRHKTFAELQDQTPIPQVDAVERAVTSCIVEASRFYYDVQREQLMLTMGGEPMPFDMLSDGYRNLVAMVADIAWRAVVLNPQHRARAPALAQGLVLIDEIDLHLHPRWQRRVVDDLCRAFPRLQFVLTTHSPIIIQSLEPGQLRNLSEVEAAQIEAEYADESLEDIVETVMGVEGMPRSRRRQQAYEMAKDYYDLLDRIEAGQADDPAERARLEAELDQLLAPYASNQALVAFLERKRARAEGGKKS